MLINDINIFRLSKIAGKNEVIARIKLK